MGSGPLMACGDGRQRRQHHRTVHPHTSHPSNPSLRATHTKASLYGTSALGPEGRRKRGGVPSCRRPCPPRRSWCAPCAGEEGGGLSLLLLLTTARTEYRTLTTVTYLSRVLTHLTQARYIPVCAERSPLLPFPPTPRLPYPTIPYHTLPCLTTPPTGSWSDRLGSRRRRYDT